jgi:LysM repeat protein
VRQPTREELARYGAPAAFLAAVTIAVVLVHNGLSGGGGSSASRPIPTVTTPGSTGRSQATTTRAATTTAASVTTDTTGAVYYTVQSGDTLGAIASRYATTSQAIEALNPGVDPAALQPGQRIRVK